MWPFLITLSYFSMLGRFFFSFFWISAFFLIIRDIIPEGIEAWQDMYKDLKKCGGRFHLHPSFPFPSPHQIPFLSLCSLRSSHLPLSWVLWDSQYLLESARISVSGQDLPEEQHHMAYMKPPKTFLLSFVRTLDLGERKGRQASFRGEDRSDFADHCIPST